MGRGVRLIANAMVSIQSATADTNILWDAAIRSRPGHVAALQIFDNHRDGICEVKVTNRNRNDVERPPERGAMDEFMRRYRIDELRSAATIGITRIGCDVIADEQDASLATDIATTVFGTDPVTLFSRSKSSRVDVDHLATHARLHRDVFVTRDKLIQRKAADLLALGITVCDPEAFLRQLEN